MNTGRVPLRDDVEPMMEKGKKNFRYKDFDRTQEENNIRTELAYNKLDPELAAQLYGTASHSGFETSVPIKDVNITKKEEGAGYLGSGYLGAGYLMPPNRGKAVKGGFWPVLLGALAGPIINGIVSLIKGKGKVSASDFYQHADALVKVHHPEHHVKYRREMHKLFGGKVAYEQILRGKSGGAKIQPSDELKVGHIIMPALMGQLKKELKGTGKLPAEFVEKIEEAYGGELNQDFTTIVEGGNFLGKIWGFIKNILPKVLGSLATSAASEVGKRSVGYAFDQGTKDGKGKVTGGWKITLHK